MHAPQPCDRPGWAGGWRQGWRMVLVCMASLSLLGRGGRVAGNRRHLFCSVGGLLCHAYGPPGCPSGTLVLTVPYLLLVSGRLWQLPSYQACQRLHACVRAGERVGHRDVRRDGAGHQRSRAGAAQGARRQHATRAGLVNGMLELGAGDRAAQRLPAHTLASQEPSRLERHMGATTWPLACH